jgi:hypothetical protein
MLFLMLALFPFVLLGLRFIDNLGSEDRDLGASEECVSESLSAATVGG